MDSGKVILLLSTLCSGALAAFFAIVLCAKSRDIARMLLAFGVITLYIEAVFTILGLFGISGALFSIGSVPLAAIALPNIRNLFFIAALALMTARMFSWR